MLKRREKKNLKDLQDFLRMALIRAPSITVNTRDRINVRDNVRNTVMYPFLMTLPCCCPW